MKPTILAICLAGGILIDRLPFNLIGAIGSGLISLACYSLCVAIMEEKKEGER